MRWREPEEHNVPHPQVKTASDTLNGVPSTLALGHTVILDHGSDSNLCVVAKNPGTLTIRKVQILKILYICDIFLPETYQATLGT